MPLGLSKLIQKVAKQFGRFNHGLSVVTGNIYSVTLIQRAMV